jgi:hypothetical protein
VAAFGGLIKMVTVAMVTKVQNGCQIQKSSDLGEIWFQNGHHSKPTIDINSQHHNLLGNQISHKSEDFCILVAIFGHHSKPKWSSYGAACLTFSKCPPI